MIRPCAADDFAAIHAIINDGASAYVGHVPADCLHDPYMSEAALAREIQAGVEFWGFEQGGALAGVMGIQHVRDVTLIRHAYVRTARRGQGIGDRLLARLKAMADRPVLIGTWAAASWAIDFYRKRGFELVPAERKDALLAAYWDVSPRQAETSVVLWEVDGGPSGPQSQP